jgi:Ca-activated chloride channel family protein
LASGAIILSELFMKRGIIGLLSVALLFGQNAKQKAASKAAPPADELSRITVDVTRVNLLYTVTDKKGRFVSNLTKDDFEILENKKQQKILEFTAETDLPLRLAILIDTSNSIRERFRFIQEAAINFVTTVMRPGKDRALVVSFDTSPELVADLTDDQVAVTKAIRDLRPGGGTALYDAIFFSCRDVLMKDQPRDKFRRAVVVLSDGDDNQSRWTREQALEMAHKADAVIYTISTNITHLETNGDKVLKRYAEETGGIAFFPFKAEDMGQSFENIANELRHQYNVFYRPDPLRTDGLYHPVEIRVKERRELSVRARHGYYAPTLPQAP